MMNKNKIFIKSLYSFILINLVFWHSVGIVQAELFSDDIPSTDEILSDVEKHYGFDQNILRRSQKKGNYPEVEVYFDKTSPKKGEKVTATAMPKYFKNSNEDLYYTWYLFREGDNLNSDQVMEKAKRRAMGIVARGDFDPFLFGSDYSGGADDPDDDGYDASFGGDDGVGGKSANPDAIGSYESSHYVAPNTKQVVDTNSITRCYRHNFGVSDPDDADYAGVQAGDDLIVECEHKFAEADSSESIINPADGSKINCNNGHDVGDGDFKNNEEACWQLDPDNPDTDGDGVKDEADLAGLGQSQLTWSFEPGDRVGVMIEGTSTMIVNESGSANSYYKITWAGLDICDKEEVEGEDKEDLIENDECERSSDYGFNYLATRSAYEKSEELLKNSLSFSPASPQISLESDDYSDFITVSSNLLQSGVSDDFVYYDWDIYYCDKDNLDNCTENISNNLTAACGNGEVLGDCSENLISNSFGSGLGKKEIKFKITEDLLSSKREHDSFFLKVFLRTKRSEGASTVGVSSVAIPITIDDNQIKFFKVAQEADGDFGFNSAADEICNNGVYNKICPVYSGQILAAEADIDTDNLGNSDVESYSWYLNDQPLDSPRTSSGSCFFSGGCDLGNRVYLPIQGSDRELQTITLKVKKEKGEEITSERIISVSNPLAKIASNDLAIAWPWVVDDGSVAGRESDDVFIGKIGSLASFRADLIPDYLNGDTLEDGISLIWYLNGKEVTPEFISDNSDYGVAIDGQKITFKLAGDEGDSINLAVKVTKEFSDDEKSVFFESWGVKELDPLRSQKSITIRQTNANSDAVASSNSSIKKFTASTLANAPEYLIFIIRTAIVLVLFWAFVVGFSYWFNEDNNFE